MLFSAETVAQFRRFLYGGDTFAEFYRWVVSAANDTDLPETERTGLSELRLLLLELDEGIRPATDIDTWLTDALLTTSSRLAARSS